MSEFMMLGKQLAILSIILQTKISFYWFQDTHRLCIYLHCRLDNLQDGLTKTPLLPTLLNYVPPELIKASKTAVFKAPSRIPEKSGCIVLTEEDGIDMEIELQDTIEKYGLNFEQAVVLRNFAHTVVRAPGWSPSSSEPPPILLVHGTFLDGAFILFPSDLV
jgi:hypothetical protein